MMTCRHRKKTFLCSEMTMQDIRRFHEAFYSTNNKIIQDTFLLKYTSQKDPSRKRSSDKKGPPKNITISYFMKTKKQGVVQVCGKFFLSILGVSKARVQRVCKTHLQTGTSPKENRGGDTISKKYVSRRMSVRTYIQSLHCIESHYTREKSVRQYLPSDYTVRKLWKAYNDGMVEDLQVKYHYFWNIFMSDFNIGFNMPATDACSECLRIKSLITSETDNRKKNELMTKYRVHTLKANAFYEFLGSQTDGIFKFSFDCQKNLVLPKLPDQAAYYSRQLYLYNMTLCEGHSKNKLNPDTVHIFAWTENQRLKGSNEIASIVHYFLCNKDLSGYDTVQLYCDGCPGQNKNLTLLGMLAKWLQTQAPPNVKCVEIIFPVVGHSYLPPDRVFGQIERVLRKKATIITPQQYKDILAQFGNVKDVGTEVPVYNWKQSVSETVKAPSQLHFQFAPSKRITLKRTKNNTVVLKGEPNYRVDIGQFKLFVKKGKSLTCINPEVLPTKVPVKPAKLKDVEKLIRKHFGDEWEQDDTLVFYKNVLSQDCVELEDNEEDEAVNYPDESEDMKI